MKTPSLSTIYLDNEVVTLMGDPCPSVFKVVAVSGKRPDAVQVLRADSANDLHGKPVRLEETLDRTIEPTKAIYLTSRTRPARGGVSVELPDSETIGSSTTADLPSREDAPRSPMAPVPAERMPPPRDGDRAEVDWRSPPSRGES